MGIAESDKHQILYEATNFGFIIYRGTSEVNKVTLTRFFGYFGHYALNVCMYP